ncbi:MAG TPA: ankyrin repeat domain-containing protein [Vicinamibacterales bacterium]|nr:ankyrin repeat domain-containing protein [Vicinamibacterales bacterium]
MRTGHPLARVAVAAGLLLAHAPAATAQLRPPLSEAAKTVDREAVRHLLSQNANVNATEGDGSTALHWAAYRDDVDTADRLLKAGAKVNVANDLGATPLWAAALNGSEAMTRRLLQAGADPNLALTSGETPLMAASRSGAPAVVTQLLAKGAKLDAFGPRGQTALMWAVAQKHPDVTRLLIAAGADIHRKSAPLNQVMAVSPHGMLQYNKDVPFGGDTALMFAARVGDTESARLLLAAGAHPGDTDAWGVSATAMAAHAGFTDIVELLLDKGADPNTSGGGFTPLHAAVMRRDERMVAALLAHKADPNAKVLSWTPTRRSSRDWNFNPELVGATPYWLAARVTAPSIMTLLLDHGADPTVVHHAVYHGGDPIVERSQTTTPLTAALGMGGGVPWVSIDTTEREALALACVQIAVAHGAEVNLANDDGRTALDAAKRLQYQSVVAFLTAHGATAGASNRPASRGSATNR